MAGLLDLLASLFRPRPAPVPVRPPVPPSPIHTPSPPGSDASGVVAAINAVRSARGLSTLSPDAGLHGTAVGWAATIAASRTLSHGDFAGRIATVHPGKPSGECIAEGFADPAAVVAGWMADPPHREILLGEFDLAGAGTATDRSGVIYWVADFAGR